MTVRVLTCTAAEILAGKLSASDDGKGIVGQLSIPEYQRPYCWQEQQLMQLLTDIRAQKEQLSDLPYYLGSLILHQENGKLNIIDGQQRVTTLVLIASLQQGLNLALVNSLEYEHPTSLQQIKHNLKWLQSCFSENTAYWQSLMDFHKLQFTLVITQTEDDAYRFFETQNTGGVRLAGTDIIKAHHLRAVSSMYQKTFAKQWEGLGKLDDTVGALLKGRYWQKINMRELPSHQQKKKLRDTIVSELAEQTAKGTDIAFGRVYRQLGLAGEVRQHLDQQGYELRQPLNAGVNTIRYLSYFQSLYQHYWERPDLPGLPGYNAFIAWLKGLEGCGYLEGLYKACLLQYISQFGEKQLEAAAKKLFRVVYSRRVSNQKAVRENSIYAFVRETPVLDWVALSYTPEQCFKYFDSFTLTVDGSNLDSNSVKKRYMSKVCQFFELLLAVEDYEQCFAQALTRKVAGGL
ncbi:DUF262 domain-containing protein [Shewanella sp. SNU WT4]|uniref:DUF262 domain-containing protein n=1 Tax=Shewanella sp. SNU WT4 TaxID=2590015 RepID=UPI00112AE1AD|nr:DUF262 domain-containing protein [Shewanella sp. SNU WT4]QDF67104.1 DUF262 domain-containing protein [Shewanella sp. SNU WT4]